ncbi:MAG: arsenosugar biosynthesis radical SAM (seleno)protein ArsS [Candidatus Sericytochromatia bacterium]
MTTLTHSRFAQTLAAKKLSLPPRSIATLQINITRLCNQACHHCHVDASPKRREMMPAEVIDACLDVLARHEGIHTLDITGGAPELHPGFKALVERACALGKQVMVRHNLTVSLDPHPLTGESMAWLPEFFAMQRVEVVSSLPFYETWMTDRQRGRGVFAKSLESIKALNALGYGQPGSGLVLNLVSNPVGAFLPASQAGLEADFRRGLAKQEIVFNQLFTLTNMPIKRFADELRRSGHYEAYLEKLIQAFNPAAAAGVMCRDLISVGYDGTVYDCDFNQMLELPIDLNKPDIRHFDLDTWLARPIVWGDHCFGCTAGAGSSCGGTTA